MSRKSRSTYTTAQTSPSRRRRTSRKGKIRRDDRTRPAQRRKRWKAPLSLRNRHPSSWRRKRKLCRSRRKSMCKYRRFQLSRILFMIATRVKFYYQENASRNVRSHQLPKWWHSIPFWSSYSVTIPSSALTHLILPVFSKRHRERKLLRHQICLLQQPSRKKTF